MSKTIRVYINKMTPRGKNIYGFLTHFHVYGLHWKLYFRGDAPLIIYHTENVLQVDGDVYCPVSSNLCGVENKDELFDSFLFKAEDAVDFFATMVYEDMELEHDEDLPDNDYDGPDYDLEYEGENLASFQMLQDKIQRNEVLIIEDLQMLNEKPILK